MQFVFDMETGDPDDFLTLCLLAGHPLIDLIAVTVTPGTPHQIGLVRWGLERFGLDIPVGAFNLDHKKARGTPDEHYVTCVSPWHFNTFGEIEPSREAEPGFEVLSRVLGPDTRLVTGAALKNLGRLLKTISRPGSLGQLTVQGGFAGDNIVPPEHRLPKFEGRITCPTYNLNGDPKAAKAVLACRMFERIQMVSKNVCHGVIYDQAMHDRLMAVPDPHPGLQMVMRGMASYLQKSPEGKKFHDPLAAMCALDPGIGVWASVEPYRERGQWGCRPSEEPDAVQIITAYDHERFMAALIGQPLTDDGRSATPVGA